MELCLSRLRCLAVIRTQNLSSVSSGQIVVHRTCLNRNGKRSYVFHCVLLLLIKGPNRLRLTAIRPNPCGMLVLFGFELLRESS